MKKYVSAFLVWLVLWFTLLQTAAFAQGHPATSFPYAPPPVDNVNAQVLGDSGTATSNFSPASMTPLSITRLQIPQTHITANGIILGGYRTIGDLGQGAPYVCGPTVSSTAVLAIQDADGVWCALSMHNNQINEGWFGATGDDGATLVTSGDIAANPQWRACVVVGDSWDWVATQNAVYAAYAANSTPCVSSTLHIVWNAPSTYNLNRRLFVPVATYGLNEQLNLVAAFLDIDFETNAAIWDWTGPASTVMIKMNSAAYGELHNFHIQNAERLHQSLNMTPTMIMDHDGSAPTGTLSTQQLNFTNCWFAITGQDQNGIQLNPVSGGNGQGSVIGFHHCQWQGNTGAQYAFQNNGSNAISNICDVCDFIGWTKYAIDNIGGASMRLFNVTMENQNPNGSFFSPFSWQGLRNGADFYSPSVITSNTSRVNMDREESDVGTICISGGCQVNEGAELVGSSPVNWSANATDLIGQPIAPSNAPAGTIFVLSGNGANITNGHTMYGWRDIATTSTKCRVDDAGPGGTPWTPSQWVGFGVAERFTNGSTFFPSIVGSNPVLWNTATSVGWCVETNSQISASAGGPVTAVVNSISQGGNNIAAGDSVLDPFGATYGTIASPTGPGGVGSWTMNFATAANETMNIGPGPVNVAAQITGTVLNVTKVRSGGNNIAPGQTIVDINGVTLGTIHSNGTGTGGVGTYNVDINIAAEAMEIGPIPLVGPDALPPGNDEYTMTGVTGGTIPAGFATTKGTMVIGQSEGGNSGSGVSTIAGSPIVGLGLSTAGLSGQQIMIPDGTWLGSCASCAELPTGFFATLSNVAPTFTLASFTATSCGVSCFTITVTTSSPHGMPTGLVVGAVISGVTPSGYNCTTCSITVTGPSTFTYQITTNPGTVTVPGQVVPSIATMSFNADVTVTKETAYFSPIVTDGQVTWFQLDFDAFNGARELMGARWNAGKVENIGQADLGTGILNFLRPALGGGTRVEVASGFNIRQQNACPPIISGVLTLTPYGVNKNGSDFVCAVNSDVTVNVTLGNPADYASTMNVVWVSNGTAHVITYGTGFKSGLPTLTTPATLNKEINTEWVFDGGSPGQWNPSVDPAVAGSGTITGVTAGAGITGGGTSGTVTVTNASAAVTGAVKSNGSGTYSQAACGDLSNAILSCSTHAATLQSAPLTPTPITGTTLEMLGMGSSCPITPTTSGNIIVSIIFGITMSGPTTAGDGTKLQLRWGTGTPPTNGAATTGTLLGVQVKDIQGATPTSTPVYSRVLTGTIVGATVGVPLWVDGAEADASANHEISALNTSCSGGELN